MPEFRCSENRWQVLGARGGWPLLGAGLCRACVPSGSLAPPYPPIPPATTLGERGRMGRRKKGEARHFPSPSPQAARLCASKSAGQAPWFWLVSGACVLRSGNSTLLCPSNLRQRGFPLSRSQGRLDVLRPPCGTPSGAFQWTLARESLTGPNPLPGLAEPQSCP